MESKLFQKNDSGFICANCGREVAPLGYTSRNHCPFCLWSLHVDENPGDRANPCGGKMQPIAAAPDARHGYVIYHRCTRCGEVRRNKAAYGVEKGADSLKLIIELTAKPQPDLTKKK